MLTSESKIRGIDLMTSIALMLFSLWGLYESFKMPMKDTYGGVSNVWYVSPALFPIIVNSGLLILSIGLLVFSIKKGGLSGVSAFYSTKQHTGFKPEQIKFYLILVLISSQAYIFLPSVDFYLSMVLFLYIFIACFYFDDFRLMKRLGYLYTGYAVILGILRFSGVMKMMTKVFFYTFDVLTLFVIIISVMIVSVQMKSIPEMKRKKKIVLRVSIISPLILVLVFKFMLLIPMPKEGGIINLMNLLYFTIR